MTKCLSGLDSILDHRQKESVCAHFRNVLLLLARASSIELSLLLSTSINSNKIYKANIFRIWKIMKEQNIWEKKTYEVNLTFTLALFLGTRQSPVVLLGWRHRDWNLVLLEQLESVRQDPGEHGGTMEAQKGFPKGVWLMAGLYSPRVRLLKS